MNIHNIEISDILGSKRININTPVIVLENIPKRYLISINTGRNEVDGIIFNVDYEKLHHDLMNKLQFIDHFIPVGQVIIPFGQNTYNMIMANTRIVPTTNNYEEINKNVWVGVMRQRDRMNRSIGTIYSEGKPNMNIPVFPSSFLKKQDSDDLIQSDFDMYKNIYSDVSHGKYTLNKYKFNVDKTHLRMIDSAGEISNMFIPTATSDIIDDNFNNSDKKFNQNVYFTTQGSIVSDTNCVQPMNNMHKATLNECNGIHIDDAVISDLSRNIMANDEEMLDLNNISLYQDVFSPNEKKSKLLKRGRTLVLKEKDEPWFRNVNIVGEAAMISRPHKVTGVYTDNDRSMFENKTIHNGVVDGTHNDMDVVNALHTSDCVGKDTKGYSRLDTERKCRGIEKFKNGNDDDCNNSNSEVKMDHINNVIMFVMCIIIIILLFYRRNY